MAVYFDQPYKLGSSIYMNTVGTIKLVNGVPTGSIIESGSNSNGTYIKFADGTMICSVAKTDNSIDITTASTIHGYISTGQTWIYPVAFQTVQSVHFQPIYDSSNSIVRTVFGLTDCGYHYTSNGSSVSANRTMSALAIGTWY